MRANGQESQQLRCRTACRSLATDGVASIRNLPGTSPETREKVTRAARELAYIVSDSARTLSTTKTRRIAVVSEELTNPYYPALIEPLRQYLSTQGLRAVILPDTDHEEVTLEALADGSYDGVILTTTARDSTLPRDLTERGIAHVLVNRVLDHAESHSCTVDNVGGMAEVARLMAELGHTRIASIQGPLRTSTGRQRAEALRMSYVTMGFICDATCPDVRSSRMTRVTQPP